MVSVTRRIYVNRALADVFERQLEARYAEVESKCASLLSGQTLRPIQPGDPYVIAELWESVAHFERWQEVIAAQNGLPQAAFDKPTQLEIRHVVGSPKPRLADTLAVSETPRWVHG